MDDGSALAISNPQPPATIKWPNDVLVNGREEGGGGYWSESEIPLEGSGDSRWWVWG